MADAAADALSDETGGEEVVALMMAHHTHSAKASRRVITSVIVETTDVTKATQSIDVICP